MELNKGTRIDGNTVQPPGGAPTLSDLGVSKKQSHRWQKITDVPEYDFEQHIAAV